LTYTDASQSIQVLTATDVAYDIQNNPVSWSVPLQVAGQSSGYSGSTAALNSQLFIAYAGTNNSPYITALASPGQPIALSENGYNVLVLGDVNGDGFADLVSAGSPYGGILVFGQGTSSLIDAATGTDDIVITVANASISSFVALGDVNGDGFADFGVIDSNNNFYLNLGSASMLPYGSTLTLSTPSLTSISSAFAIGDVSGDGYGDIATLAPNGAWSTYYGSTSGGLASQTPGPNGGTMNELGDLNGDGYDDYGSGNGNLYSTSYNNGQFTVYYGGQSVSQGAVSQAINPPNALISAPINANEWTSQPSIPGQSSLCAPSVVEFTMLLIA
jgi:hypothetical protein